jgi:hypothetical protein
MPQIIWAGQSGCLLPLLIVFNLLFGRPIFNSTYLWLAVEAGLILIFIIKIHVFMQRIKQRFFSDANDTAFGTQSRVNGKVVDVEGRVVEENQTKNKN